MHHGVNPKDIGLWSLFRASGNNDRNLAGGGLVTA
jgi:hypothetical protein